MTEYKKLTDEELIRRLRMGETGIIDYLMEKYKNLVRKEANAMYLLGGETDDLYCKFYEIMKYASVYVAILNVVW